MSKWQNRLYNFFYGRYGTDELYQFNLIVYLILLFINIFFNSMILFAIELILITFTFYRVLSRNVKRRTKENKFYLKIKNNIFNQFILMKRKWKDRNTHMYKKCIHCKTVLRLPLKKGVHTVKCPNCKKRFEVKCRRDEKIQVEVIKKKSNLKES